MYSRVYVEITNICNMHCSFCHGHSRTKGRMNREEFARILSQLQGKTQYIYYHLMGEPLTHPELPLFLQMAKTQGFQSVITTNGTLLGNMGCRLIDAGIHKVNISLHSFEEGTATTHLEYMRQVADFADRATKAGVIVCLRLWNNGFDQDKNDDAVGFLQERFSDPWSENSRGYRIRDNLFLEWGDRFSWPDQKAPSLGEHVFCYGLSNQFGILCDGSVVPCCLDSDGVITLGNVFYEDLEEILSSPRAAAMVRGFANRTATEDLCRRCGFARRFQ